METIYANFINNFRSLRKSLKITQSALAQNIGISSIQITRYESFESEMPLSVALKISKALGKNLSELLTEKEQIESNTRKTLHSWIDRIPEEKLETMSSLIISQIRAIAFDENKSSTGTK